MPHMLPGITYQPANWTTFAHDIEIDPDHGQKGRLKSDVTGQHYLAFEVTRDQADTRRLVHLPLEPETLRDILTGALPVGTAFREAEFFYVSDQNNDGSLIRTSMTWLSEPLPGFIMEVEGLPKENAVMDVPETTVDRWMEQITDQS